MDRAVRARGAQLLVRAATFLANERTNDRFWVHLAEQVGALARLAALDDVAKTCANLLDAAPENAFREGMITNVDVEHVSFRRSVPSVEVAAKLYPPFDHGAVVATLERHSERTTPIALAVARRFDEALAKCAEGIDFEDVAAEPPGSIQLGSPTPSRRHAPATRSDARSTGDRLRPHPCSPRASESMDQSSSAPAMRTQFHLSARRSPAGAGERSIHGDEDSPKRCQRDGCGFTRVRFSVRCADGGRRGDRLGAFAGCRI